MANSVCKEILSLKYEYYSPMNDTLNDFKFKQLVDEICKKGNVEEYRATIQSILRRIQDTGCIISWCDICKETKIEESLDPKRPNHIRITLNGVREPLHILWNILHEFGHHLDGSPNKRELTLQERQKREIAAWKFAREELQAYPELLKHIENFNEYKAECLKTYSLDSPER